MLRKGNQGKSSEPILSDLQLTGAVNRSGSLESQDTGAEPPEGEARAIHCDEAEYLQFSGSTSPLRVEQQHFGGYSSSSSFACEAEAVSERCLQVILEHEEEAASLSPAILLQRLKEVQSGRQGDALYPDDYAPADCPHVGQTSTTNEGPQTSQPVDGVAFDVDKTTFRHKPHVESERNRAETQQDSQVQEQDIALYATRTTAILLLSGPSPVRLDDLRRCWMASPMLLRKRNLTALILNRTAGIAASCFGLHLLSFLTKGEEELRGFLLFLSTQFLCLQAELPLRTLKSSLWSVGRQDLLRDFDGGVTCSCF
ncbi:hypothetical protein, conserved [Eimeria necatrix]|uniref:Uncharacterized protein n=1 Tax=Eimeria necatrix TaxID=51315 RepID=U6MS72_9EIME|nr:hypothetical protein, conserved [Eimeria necatrix]CDJ65324.1 hypothetical protein, conserved [Eimeria necatrix]